MITEKEITEVQSVLDINYWNSQAEEISKKYQSQEPYPHIVLDEFLRKESAEIACNDFPEVNDPRWILTSHYSKKTKEICNPELIPDAQMKVIDALQSDEFIQILEKITGFKGLIPDKPFTATGLHIGPRGGFLKVHSDFLTHYDDQYLRRRVNLIVYLNDDWKEEYGGHLEVWSKDLKDRVSKTLPALNRCLIFSTDKDTMHGYPDPLQCPPEIGRKSIILLYFTKEDTKTGEFSTHYKARANDNRALVGLDYALLRYYDKLKVMLHKDDTFVSNIAKLFGRKK